MSVVAVLMLEEVGEGYVCVWWGGGGEARGVGVEGGGGIHCLKKAVGSCVGVKPTNRPLSSISLSHSDNQSRLQSSTTPSKRMWGVGGTC